MTGSEKKPTKRQQALIEAAGILTDAPTEKDLAFLTRYLVQCTLPHKNPGDVPLWTRKNGDLSLVLQPGYDTEKAEVAGYPYGSIPRLILYWITAEASRTRSRRLELGHHLDSFMREVGLNPDTGGGKRGDAKRLHVQLDNLLSCRITFHQTAEGSGRTGKRWQSMLIAPKGELWWNPKDPHTGTLWGSWIELGEEFFEAITTGLIPLDTRALAKLKRSPLDLDLYAWCAYNAFRAHRGDKAIWTTWRVLARALGADYANIKELSRNVRRALRNVRAVYPGLSIETHRSGLTILPDSTPPVPQKLIVDKSVT